MKQHLAILLWATDPDVPDRCATPFFHAATAAALEVEVEVYFSARAVLLLDPVRAKELFAGRQREASILDHMHQARGHGARFFACPDALLAQGLTHEQVKAQVDGFAGAATFMSRALDPEWATLTY